MSLPHGRSSISGDFHSVALLAVVLGGRMDDYRKDNQTFVEKLADKDLGWS